jgi:hypothetical protein
LIKNIPRRFIDTAQTIDPIVLYIQNFCSFIPLAPAINGTNALVKLWNLPRVIYQKPFFSICFESIFCSVRPSHI